MITIAIILQWYYARHIENADMLAFSIKQVEAFTSDANTRQITTTVDLQAGESLPFSATLVPAEDRLYLSQINSVGANSIVVKVRTPSRPMFDEAAPLTTTQPDKHPGW